MTEKFRDKVVWITGASSGIGREVALEFARQGASIAVSGRRKERLERVVGEIESLGGKGLAVACDVTDEDSLIDAVKQVVKTFGKLDVTVANAGFGVSGSIETLSADDWKRQLDTNVIGLAMTVKHSLAELTKTKGRLALVASVASMIVAPKAGAYTASKYAVRAIGQTLAIELHGSGVSCTTIHPGFVESDIARVDNDGVFDPNRKDKRPAKLMWAADRAARVMVNAIYKRKREYTFTGHGKVGGFFGRHFPGVVHFAITRFGGRR